MRHELNDYVRANFCIHFWADKIQILATIEQKNFWTLFYKVYWIHHIDGINYELLWTFIWSGWRQIMSHKWENRWK